MPNAKILIVDDEPFNLDYLEQELADLNYETIRAVNGRAALEVVQSVSPDLILLDIMMPIMDGFEVLSRLKANPATRHIPVIIISAHSDLQNMVRGIQNGAEEYLPKPFEPVLLEARISSCLEKKRLRDVEQQYLKSLEREFEIAREIQAGFLPNELPQLVDWQLSAYFQAAREVAGDFYDAFLLPDGNLMVVIGDVCGKGVGAALFMTLFRSLIRATSTTDTFCGSVEPVEFTPSVRLKHVIDFTNHYIAATHGESSMFATVFIGILNPLTGQLTYINCGNEAPLVMRAGQVSQLPPTGPVVGVIEEASFGVKEIQLLPQDTILLFTDGIPDSQNAAGAFFGHEPIHTLVNQHPIDATSLVEQLRKLLQAFADQEHPFDDVTILALHRN